MISLFKSLFLVAPRRGAGGSVWKLLQNQINIFALVARSIYEQTNFTMEIRVICKLDEHFIVIVFLYLK